jgi:hypothetical protein
LKHDYNWRDMAAESLHGYKAKLAVRRWNKLITGIVVFCNVLINTVSTTTAKLVKLSELILLMKWFSMRPAVLYGNSPCQFPSPGISSVNWIHNRGKHLLRNIFTFVLRNTNCFPPYFLYFISLYQMNVMYMWFLFISLKKQQTYSYTFLTDLYNEWMVSSKTGTTFKAIGLIYSFWAGSKEVSYYWEIKFTEQRLDSIENIWKQMNVGHKARVW